MKTEYNYVLFMNSLGNNKKFLELINYDIKDEPEVVTIYGATGKMNKWERLIHKIHFSPKINRRINLPLKKLWNARYFRNQFKNDKPICFVVDRSNDVIFQKGEYYSYIRKKYLDCKLIFIFRDRVEGTSLPYYEEKRNRIIDIFDKILVYNLYDSVRFGFSYFSAYESKVPIQTEQGRESIDLFYAGWAKDRVAIIQDIAREAKKHNLNCYFYIYKATAQERIPIPGIVYADEWMPFDELLRYAASSKCMVDILQGEAAGFTSRFWHAVFYDKLLISNNPIIKFTRYYSEEYMQYICSVEDIDFEQIKNSDMPQYAYMNEFSCKRFIGYMDALLVRDVTPEEYYRDWFDIESYKLFLGL